MCYYIEMTRHASSSVAPGRGEFLRRAEQYITDVQFARITHNLGETGVIDFLGGRENAWTNFRDVVGGITEARAELDLASTARYAKAHRRHPLDLTTTFITFKDRDARASYHDLQDLALAGIGGTFMPHARDIGKAGLEVRNFSYAEARTFGRLGTATFTTQFRGRDTLTATGLRVVVQQDLNTIETSGVDLPSELQSHMAQQRQDLAPVFGEEVGNTLLTSGNFSLVGRALRQELEGRGPLAVQREWGNRPKVEDGANFISRDTSGGIPLSRATVGAEVAHSIRGHVEGIAEPFRGGHVTHMVAGAWEVVSDLGLTAGIKPAADAAYLLSSAALAGFGAERYAY